MEDSTIVGLFFERDERAISETASKYGRYLRAVAYNILRCEGDAEEIVNDTYLGAWNSIPPQRPESLSGYLGKIARQLSIRRLRDKNAGKRGGGEATLAIDELADCVTDGHTIDDELESAAISRAIDAFLRTLGDTERRVFIRRYFYCDSVRDVAARFGFRESRVKMMLHRTRKKLAVWLTKEGITI